MQTTAAQARHQQEVEELCVAAIRALSGERDLHFRGRLLHRGERRLPLHAPHLYPEAGEDFASFRGAADGMALRLSLSDAGLHQAMAPEGRVERALFELLEQFRVESLVPDRLSGVAANLRHRHERWSLAFHRSGLTETSRGLLLYTVTQVCRAQVTGQPVVEETEDLLEATRAGLAPVLGEDLAALRRHRHHQRPYGQHAAAVATTVAGMLSTERLNDSADDDGADDDGADDDVEGMAFSLFVDFDEEAEPFSGPAPGSNTSEDADDAGEPAYRVFTTTYDQQVDIGTLVRPDLLRRFRDALDDRVAQAGVNIHRLGRELRALLAEPVEGGWDAAQEEGRIDGRRLARLVTAPSDHRLFRAERVEPLADCLVTFLVDCSGSMKQHAEHVAVLVDVFGRALDLAGVQCEVLGFTTGAWHGGRAARDWRRAGSPRRPGRLNEVSHIVVKDADKPWPVARRGVAGLLRRELFREGVDGEAVGWARARMLARPEPRRLLVVVSDGSPMDGATSLANDERYLDRHLRAEVARCVESPDLDVVGLGVGLDLSPYFPRSHTLDLSDGVSNGTVRELLGLLARAHHR